MFTELRSGDVADKPGREVTGLAPTRDSLIAQGTVVSASHGDAQVRRAAIRRCYKVIDA